MIVTERPTLLAILLAVLVVNAGCSSFTAMSDAEPDRDLPTSTPDPQQTPTRTATPTPTPTPETNDLRNISIGTNESIGVVGSDDPQGENGYYEAVAFAGDAGQMVNIKLLLNSGKPNFTLIAPNGSVLVSNSWSDTAVGAAVSKNITLPETGEYTIRVTSPNTDSFAYSLSLWEWTPVNDRGWFAGDPVKWNESERYAEFALDFQEVATEEDNYTDMSPVRELDAVNPAQDYVIVTAELTGDDPSPKEVRAVDIAMLLTYAHLVQAYQNASEDQWIPDRVYVRHETPEGELFKTFYWTTEQAKDYHPETNESVFPHWLSYRATKKHGPANSQYVEGAANSTDELYYEGMNRSAERSPSP